MTTHEENKFNMYGSVIAVIDSNVTLVSQYPAIATVATELKVAVTAVEETDIAYNTATPGKTAEKNSAAEGLIDNLMPLKAALYSYAAKTKNEGLKELVSISESKLRHLTIPALIQTAETIHKAALENLPGLGDYKITETDLPIVQRRIGQLKITSGNKSMGFANRTALRKTLTEKIKIVDDLLEEHLDNLIELIRKDNPQVYNQYFAARVIKDLGGGRNNSGEENKSPEGNQPVQ